MNTDDLTSETGEDEDSMDVERVESEYTSPQWGGEKALAGGDQYYRELIHETFIEIQDYLHAESISIGDDGWSLFAFMEFMMGLEIV